MLGRKGKDVITGFEGTIMAACDYLTGCRQILLVAPLDKDGKRRDGEWFDENRIVVSGERVQLADEATPRPLRVNGADIAAPGGGREPSAPTR